MHIFFCKRFLSQGAVVSMKDVSSFLDMRRCKNRAHKIGSEGNGTPLQYSCLENPMDGGAW